MVNDKFKKFAIRYLRPKPYLVSLWVLAPIWLPLPLILLEAVPARLILDWGANETLCGVVKVSLLDRVLEDDGVIVFRFLSARTELPELLDLF